MGGNTQLLALDSVVDTMKQSGYIYSDQWVSYLNQFKRGDNNISYPQLLQQLSMGGGGGGMGMGMSGGGGGGGMSMSGGGGGMSMSGGGGGMSMGGGGGGMSMSSGGGVAVSVSGGVGGTQSSSMTVTETTMTKTVR